MKARSKLICRIFNITTSPPTWKTGAENADTHTDTCLGTGLCLPPFVCAGVGRMLNSPVALLRRSLPHGERLGKAQRKDSIALTITTFPPHGSLSVVDLRLSGHIIVVKMPVVDPHKQQSFPLYRYPEDQHDIGQGHYSHYSLSYNRLILRLH